MACETDSNFFFSWEPCFLNIFVMKEWNEKQWGLLIWFIRCLVQNKGSCKSGAGQSGVGGKLMHMWAFWNSGLTELDFYHKWKRHFNGLFFFPRRNEIIRHSFAPGLLCPWGVLCNCICLVNWHWVVYSAIRQTLRMTAMTIFSIRLLCL